MFQNIQEETKDQTKEETRLKKNILANVISKKYILLSAHREENIDINTDLEEECTKIDVLSAEIETCLKSILELKEKKQCENCHAEIELNASFCPKCGEKQPVEEVKVAEVVDANAADSAETPKTEENAEAENTVEKVTEVMSQETQENAKEEMGGNTDNQ